MPGLDARNGRAAGIVISKTARAQGTGSLDYAAQGGKKGPPTTATAAGHSSWMTDLRRVNCTQNKWQIALRC